MLVPVKWRQGVSALQWLLFAYVLKLGPLITLHNC